MSPRASAAAARSSGFFEVLSFLTSFAAFSLGVSARAGTVPSSSRARTMVVALMTRDMRPSGKRRFTARPG